MFVSYEIGFVLDERGGWIYEWGEQDGFQESTVRLQHDGLREPRFVLQKPGG